VFVCDEPTQPVVMRSRERTIRIPACIIFLDNWFVNLFRIINPLQGDQMDLEILRYDFLVVLVLLLF